MIRRMLALAACLSAASLPAANTPAAAQDFRVTLLGTGSPNQLPDRFGPSTLVEAGQEKLLFDFGRGLTIRLNQIKAPMGAITAHFLTHFHSDHVNGLPDLWLTGWIDRPYSARRGPTPDQVIAQTRETYSGPLVSGVDLMAFDVKADKVDVVANAAK